MTHQPQQILVRVDCKDRLPKEKGSYIIGNGTKIKTDYFNGKKFSYDFHNETTYWYEPATRIVLTEEELQDLLSDARSEGYGDGSVEGSSNR